MKMKLFTAIFLLAGIMSTTAFSQRGLVKGKIINSDSVPLPFVTIKNITKGIHVFTDSLGRYEFTCDRFDFLVFTLTGYKDYNLVGDSLYDKRIFVMRELNSRNGRSINASSTAVIGYNEANPSNVYKISNYRQSSIIVSYDTHHTSFVVDNFRFFLYQFDQYLDLRVRVTLSTKPNFKSEKSYSVTMPSRHYDDWYNFDLSQSNLVFDESQVYIKIDFLDNGLELCRGDSAVNVMFTRDPDPTVKTKKTNFRFYEDGYCHFPEPALVSKDNLYSSITIRYEQ
jgi:hypothetical protein